MTYDPCPWSMVFTEIPSDSESTELNLTRATIHWATLNNVPSIFLDFNFILFLRNKTLESHIFTFGFFSLCSIKTFLTEREKGFSSAQISEGGRKEEKEGGRERKREGGRAWFLGFQIKFHSGAQIMTAGSSFSPSPGFAFYLMGFKLILHEVLGWLTTLPKPYPVRFKSREKSVLFF